MSPPDESVQGSEPWLAPGTVLGRYTLGRRLGRGGMGEVYEGTHSALKRRVALKVLRPEVAQNPRLRTRFEREGVAVARVEHPHVVEVFDVGVEQGVAFLVMEFLEGEDLGAMLRRVPVLPVERAVELMLPILAAVGAAHEVGVIHRDLKPSNIFLARTRQGVEVPRVLDFGIARIADGDHSVEVTRNSAILGTPHYIAPEMARGAKHVDARSDQYSLAVILYQCLAGQRPFEGSNLYETVQAIVHRDPTPLDEVRRDIPRGLVMAVSRALAKKPEDRHDNVIAFGRAIVQFAGSRMRVQWGPVFGETEVDDSEPTTMAIPAGYDLSAPRPAVDGPTPTPSVDMGPVARSVSASPNLPRDAEGMRARMILWGSAALAVLSVGTSVALVSRARPAAGRLPSVAVAPPREVSPLPLPPVVAAPAPLPVVVPVIVAPVVVAPAAPPTDPPVTAVVDAAVVARPLVRPPAAARPNRPARPQTNGAPILR